MAECFEPDLFSSSSRTGIALTYFVCISAIILTASAGSAWDFVRMSYREKDFTMLPGYKYCIWPCYGWLSWLSKTYQTSQEWGCVSQCLCMNTYKKTQKNPQPSFLMWDSNILGHNGNWWRGEMWGFEVPAKVWLCSITGQQNGNVF